MVTCRCNGVQLFQVFLTTAEAAGVLCVHRYIMPCPYCNLRAYSAWFVRNHREIAELSDRIVKQETYIAKTA